ncbi:MAG: hypothetical protein WKF86_00210 [Acidimicrobiales bacterium]
MADHDDDGQLEARPIESGEPSELMTALVAGVNAAAETGQSLSTQLTGISNDVARAHRRRGGVIGGAAIVAVLVLIQGGVFLWSQVVAREERATLLECSSPSRPGDRHECFEEREAESGARTGRAAIAVALCFADRVPDVQGCVEKIIAAAPPGPDPQGAP